MQKAFEEIQPDVIITTWSACARMIGSVSVPIYVCITDLGVHEGWIAPHVQGYFVATQDVAEKLIGMGVEKRKIRSYLTALPLPA